MSPVRADPQPISDREIQQIASDLASGHPSTVWFTAAAVGMEAGRSGKVIEVRAPDEIDFLRVRPTGSTDTLSFSPSELTLTKPARQRKRATTRKPRSLKPDPSTQTTLW